MPLLPPMGEKEYFERRAYVREQFHKLYVTRMFAKELKRLNSTSEDTLVRRNRTRVLRHGEHLLYSLGQARRQFYGSRDRQKLMEKRFACLQDLANHFYEHNQPLVLVGGALRDHFMRLPLGNDFDLTTEAPVEFVEEALAACGYTVYAVGNSRNFGTIFAKKQSQEVQITVVEEIERDLNNRDFSFNSIGLDLNGTWVGAQHYDNVRDARNRILRACNGNAYTMLRNDPLRILRAFRMAAKFGIQMDAELLRAVRHNAHLLNSVSKERIGMEVVKIFQCAETSDILRQMFNSGVLSVLFPMVSGQLGWFSGTPSQMPLLEETFETVRLIEKASGSWKTRMAGFFANLHKPFSLNEDGTFGPWEQISAEFASDWLSSRAIPLVDVKFITKIILEQKNWDFEKMPTIKQIRQFLHVMGDDDQFKAMINFLKARAALKAPEHNNTTVLTQFRAAINQIENREALYKPKPQFSASEVMKKTGLGPGPVLGRLMRRLLNFSVLGEKVTPKMLTQLAEEEKP